mgnify:CR=1 FL=1
MQSEACAHLIRKLEREGTLTEDELVTLLACHTNQDSRYLLEKANQIRQQHFGNRVYLQQRIEYTNYCKNECSSCSLRKESEHVLRYRMHFEEIMECCETGYRLGFRTFLLSGGEDPYYTDARLLYLLRSIRQRFPECMVLLSIGERSRESYKAYFRAGASGYLLRHSTTGEANYEMLHPPEMSFEKRIRYMQELKKIGYQVGTDFIIGLPEQRTKHLAKSLLFMKELNPQMVELVPYFSREGSDFWNWKELSLELALFLTAVLRMMLPEAFLSAPKELSAFQRNGRIRGILAGANLITLNLADEDIHSSKKEIEAKEYEICWIQDTRRGA